MIDDTTLEVLFPAGIRILNDVDAIFHLTGSRFFRNPTLDSDWDFFMSASNPTVVDELVSRGFTVHKPDSYIGVLAKSQDLVTLLQYDPNREEFDRFGNEIPPMITTGSKVVQVQVCSDVLRRTSVQNHLKRLFPFGFKSKQESRVAWTTAYSLII